MQSDLAGRTLIVAAALALLSAPALADGDPARGQKLAYTCMGCHGIAHYKNAYPKYSVPKLGGQSADYIAAALASYQAGARWHPTMTGLASSLSEQDRADLGAYFAGFASLKPAAKPAGTAPAAAAACAACHGADGVGTLPENPTLAGQHADYLAQALNDYRSGRRKNPIMGTFAAQLTKEDIAAITAYFARQPGLTTPKLD
ncbi:MAG TPA: c-type cytochrome [Steroidobacteraceae bacterium]|nr:c-type cytochrome [Steroidobacteraceae bacterium]